MYSRFKNITETPKKLFSFLNSVTITVLVAFTSLMALSLFWNIHNDRLHALAHAELKARAMMDKDLEYRLWPMNHGGVYVPVTELTQPNSHLNHVPERDILTVSGQHLTLINQTIQNQSFNKFDELPGGQGHVTSLNLLNKQNAPDNWERSALLEFNHGAKEKFEVVGKDNSKQLRLMKPLITYEGCLKCHGIQNIKVGDIRGGIGVSVPIAPHMAIENRNIQTVAISHMFIWFLGVTGIGAVYSKGRSVILERVAAEMTLMEQQRQKAALHEQLLQSQKMEAIGQFAGGIAHDFNNILTVIHGFATMLKGGLTENDPQGAEVDHILTAADRAAQLTRSLLLFSRKQISEPKPVDLNQIIHGMEKFLFRVIKEDITLRTEFWPAKLIIHADIGQIEQVLMNLASNSRDAMPGGGTLLIKSEAKNIDEQFIRHHGFGKSGDYALVSVTDNGIGMDDDICQKIYEPFFTTKEAGKGTGLGLAMVYGIVKQHQGYIDVKTHPGQGATFNIYLPIFDSNQNDEQQAIHVNYIEGGNETILVAEDDPATRDLLVTTLNSYGYKVLEASDGNEAVNISNEHPDAIQLLLLDIIMPSKSGLAAYEDIIRMRPNIRTIFMTGYPVDMYKSDQSKYVGCSLIMKPIFVVELTRKIREMLS